MASEEQRLIDDLFARLKSAETHTGERDTDAEQRIAEHVRQQPAAPYYMAQTILMQEAALKRLQSRVEQLEQENREQRSSGGFLAGLFGAGGKSEGRATQHPTGAPASQPGWGARAEPGQSGRGVGSGMSGRGGGFLGGALQTAAGVAGGVMLGNLLMDMFGHHQPEEMAGVLDDPAAEHAGAAAGGNDPEAADDPDDAAGFTDTGFDGLPGLDDDGFDEL
ncbi:hypothetical protein C7446_1572 [Kushneria sinocarnis]|uniref:DUF2076 family protein n=1 Tax=Kushneria sinocarnis TaxID=595502 RepID=A0A420WXA4_9GAMM|nr:DUF2076 domain-containing protein [Kushneria sinocarnis]RKR04366.1 hypothetical protein C7446_1572 [Kushneria sinocarnis]